MSFIFSVATSLSFALGKFLLKKYLNDDGVNAVYETLADVTKPKIKDLLSQKKAVREIDDLSDKILREINSRLEEESSEQSSISAEDIAKQLADTLAADLSTEFFLAGDLDPRRVVEAYKKLRPLPNGILNQSSSEAYDRILDHTVRCLVGLANQLPEFQTQAVAASLQRLRNLEETAEKTFTQLRQMEKAVQRLAAPGDSQKFELEYRQGVAANLDYIELFGVSIPRELRRFQLTEAFVSLNLQRSLKHGEKLKKNTAATSGYQDEQPDSELLSCESVMSRLQRGEGRLLIRGAAGSGKTTLVRWIAIQAASTVKHRSGFGNLPNLKVEQFKLHNLDFAALDLMSKKYIVTSQLFHLKKFDVLDIDAVLKKEFGLQFFPWNEQIPFVVLLRHCPGGKLPLAEDFPRLIGEGVGTPPADWVRIVLKDGRGLVLLDGVDEVPPDQREEVVRGIEHLTKHYPDSYFIVTTRPEAVEPDWLAHLGFREAHLNPMGQSDVELFIRRWHDIAERTMLRVGKATDLSDKRQKLLEQLEENQALRPLATYPLLCGSICALHLDRAGTLPETQSALCEAMCDSLLHHREREQQEFDLKPFPAAYRDLSVDQKRTLIQDLAVYMVEEGRSALPQSQARDRLANKLAGFKDRSANEAEMVLKGLLERSGVLREPLPGQVDFLHNTFKEFLAGEYFASERSINKLLEHVFAAIDGAESWRRITLFAAGSRSAPGDFICELIERLLQPNSKKTTGKTVDNSEEDLPDNSQRMRHLLALQCQIVADGRGLSPKLKARLAKLVEKLFPPRTLSDAESLASLRDQAVPHLNRPMNGQLSDDICANCIRALRLINTSTARRALEEYRDVKSDAAMDELSQVFDPLTLPGVITQLIKDDYWDSRVSETIRARIINLAALESLPNLTGISLRKTGVTDFNVLKKLNHLEWLNLAETTISDLSVLAKFSKLRWLALNNTAVSNFSSLKGLTSLRELHLSGTMISGLSSLKGLTALRLLSLAGTKVSEIWPLKRITALRELHLNGTDVCDISPLKGLINLEFLSLGATKVTDVSPLKGLTALRVLHLNGTNVWDVSPLKGLTNLEILSLGDTKVSDVSPLKGLTALRALHLNGTNVCDVSPLKGLTNLKFVSLGDTKVSDASALNEILGLEIYRGSSTGAIPP